MIASRSAFCAALALALGGCTVGATGFSTDFRTVRTATATASTGGSPALVGPDGVCSVPSSRPRPAGVEIGMSECALADLLGRASDVEVDEGGSGRVARLTYNDPGASGGAVTYVFTGDRLTRIER